ncbi:MAG: hypothetical protein HKO53_12950 [Gemmatimonadetes bacterium]|nr:hypothetical protein [Gemmatimonadota bacterium]NNM33974.1 hypothetical protein [Gemmatimonadota bacterium]
MIHILVVLLIGVVLVAALGLGEGVGAASAIIAVVGVLLLSGIAWVFLAKGARPR